MSLTANHRTPPGPDSIDELLAEARALSHQISSLGPHDHRVPNLIEERDEPRVQAPRALESHRHPEAIATQIAALEYRLAETAVNAVYVHPSLYSMFGHMEHGEIPTDRLMSPESRTNMPWRTRAGASARLCTMNGVCWESWARSQEN